jgi:hypothetical protein
MPAIPRRKTMSTPIPSVVYAHETPHEGWQLLNVGARICGWRAKGERLEILVPVDYDAEDPDRSGSAPDAGYDDATQEVFTALDQVYGTCIGGKIQEGEQWWEGPHDLVEILEYPMPVFLIEPDDECGGDTSTARDIFEDNPEDIEVIAALMELRPGENRDIGGGAQAVVRITRKEIA